MASFFVKLNITMIYTRNVILTIEEVPDTWVYEYFTGVPKLSGQRELILSIFNSRDTSPSLVFYRKGGEYLFQDFSEGIGGNKVMFYKYYLKYTMGIDISFVEAGFFLMNIYSEYLLKHDYKRETIVDKAKYKIESYELRTWYDYDAKYWQQYNISSEILAHFNVKPLKVLMISDGIHSYNIKRGMTYGYFKNDGAIYRTYSPLESKDKRFNIYENYIQGWEQLRCNSKTLVICSSLKDGMSLYSLGYDVDIIAPTSENSYLSLENIDYLKSCYSKILVLFDYDDAGERAAAEYKKRFNLDNIVVPLSKDISDSIRDYSGTRQVKTYLNPHLK